VRDRLTRSVLRYYVALRLTAGFDERERLTAPDGRVGIVTLPERIRMPSSYSLN
jgi:hypothetical protein